MGNNMFITSPLSSRKSQVLFYYTLRKRLSLDFLHFSWEAGRKPTDPQSIPSNTERSFLILQGSV